MRRPGIEPGSQEWESCMIPLHQRRPLSFGNNFTVLLVDHNPSLFPANFLVQVTLNVFQIFPRVKATARLAQSVEHETLNLRVVGSSPTLGEFLYVTKLLRRRNKRIKGIVEVHGSLLLPNHEKVTRIVPSHTPVVQKLILYLVYAI